MSEREDERAAEARASSAREQDLDALLTRLPRPRAPEALHARLAAMVEERTARAEKPRWPRALAGLSALALAAAVLLVVNRVPEPAADNGLVREVVNDHLRVLYAEHPIEIESGGIHQVKPWFAGRLDFAPRVTVEDDPEFPLQGGSVSYVLDRKAATFVYKRRLHTITLFVFPARELPWPHGSEQPLGASEAQSFSVRGFNVLVFKREDLGYALVSDLNAHELRELGEKLAR
jgi:anti-sigma factor RsiW